MEDLRLRVTPVKELQNRREDLMNNWKDLDLDLELEKKRKEMIDRVNRIKYILFGLDSPLPKMFTDYNGYFKPRWDKTKTEKEEHLCSRHLWE